MIRAVQIDILNFVKNVYVFLLTVFCTVLLSSIGTGENLKANCAHAFHHEKRTNLMYVWWA